MSSSRQNLVEMHCHTVFSPDANRTPEELVEAAAAQGVGVFSITDHNHLGAQERAARHAARFDMRYVPGVEIDAVVPGGINCHFVCFDFDARHAGLQAVIAQTSSTYSKRFLEIHPHLAEFGCSLDLEEMQERLPERYPTNSEAEVNTWFARELLIEQKKVFDNDAYAQMLRQIQQKLRETNALADFPRVQFDAMRDAVHAAGGKVLLAHVSRYHRGDMDQQLSLIEELLENGMDGFELYHPDNNQEPEAHRLEEMARRTDCLLSGGSDCHDALNANRNQHFAKTKAKDWFWERLV